MKEKVNCIEKLFFWVIVADICLTVGTPSVFVWLCFGGALKTMGDFFEVWDEDEDE